MRNWGAKIDNTAPAASGILNAAEDNSRFNELKNAVTTAGITLDAAGGPDTDNQMLAQAIARYASGAVYLNGGGAVNAYTGSTTASFQLPKGYFTGMMVILRVGYTNTGAATLNVNSVGAKAIRTFSDQALIAGQIEANREIHLIYQPTFNSGAGAWVLLPWTDALFGAVLDGGPGVSFPADAAGYLYNNGSGTLSWGALTAANLASPGWFSAKSGHTLQFKGVVAGDGIKVVSNTNDLTFSAYGVEPDIMVEDRQASGVYGGTFTQGAWQTRVLNTLAVNKVSASLSGNRVTVPAGTWHGDWRCTARGVSRHQSRFRNITGNATVAVAMGGISEPFSSSANPGTQDSRGFINPFVLSVSSQMEIQHQCTDTRATDGFGSQMGFGEDNIYTVLRLWKLA